MKDKTPLEKEDTNAELFLKDRLFFQDNKRKRNARISVRTFDEKKKQFFIWCEERQIIPSRLLELFIDMTLEFDNINIKGIVKEWLSDALNEFGISSAKEEDRDLKEMRRASIEIMDKWVMDRAILLNLCYSSLSFSDLTSTCQIELENFGFSFDLDLFEKQLAYLVLRGPVSLDEEDLYYAASSRDYARFV